jgi:uncharacterized OsmC-like protein
MDPLNDTSPIRNGVDTATLMATVEALRARPELSRFEFRVRNRWESGAHCVGWIVGFHGADQEHRHRHGTTVHTDRPALLAGTDHGPTAVEYLLTAIAACLTGSLVNAAASSGVSLTKVESTVEGQIDMLGSLDPGSGAPRPGFQRIDVTVRIKGNAPPARLREIADLARASSPVYDVVAHGVPVTLAVEAG